MPIFFHPVRQQEPSEPQSRRARSPTAHSPKPELDEKRTANCVVRISDKAPYKNNGIINPE